MAAGGIALNDDGTVRTDEYGAPHKMCKREASRFNRTITGHCQPVWKNPVSMDLCVRDIVGSPAHCLRQENLSGRKKYKF